MNDVLVDDKSLAGTHVLVTGGCGFIGAALCLRLAREGANVLSVDRAKPSSSKSSGPGVVMHQQLDLAQLDPVVGCLSEFRPEVVVHLACAPDDREDFRQVKSSIDGNLALAVNLLEAFRLSGGGLFIFGDSSKVYGNSGVPFHSGTPLDPTSSYAIGKVAAWEYCRYFQRLYGLNVVSVRPTLVFGPNQPFNLFSYAIRSARSGVPAIEIAGGQQTRDPLYIDDAVEAYLAVARRGHALTGKSVSVGGGREISVVELVQRIVKLLAAPCEVRADPSRIRNTEILRSYCDNAEATRWLGWSPKVTLDDGLENTIRWIIANEAAL